MGGLAGERKIAGGQCRRVAGKWVESGGEVDGHLREWISVGGVDGRDQLLGGRDIDSHRTGEART